MSALLTKESEHNNQRLKFLGHPNKMYLDGGKVLFTNVPTLVWTVLGSCVAIVMHHIPTHLSAICHAQMPDRNDQAVKCSEHCPKPCINNRPGNDDFRFVSCSFRYMVREYEKKGIKLQDIKVHLYGGSEMFNFSKIGVGSKNLEIAKTMLRKHAMRISNEDTGGSTGRTIYFNTESGLVYVHKQNPDLLKTK